MATRIFAGILIVLFACFLYIASSDIVHQIEDRQFGGVFLLLFCVIACVGWIAFLAALCWPLAWNRSTPVHFPER